MTKNTNFPTSCRLEHMALLASQLRGPCPPTALHSLSFVMGTFYDSSGMQGFVTVPCLFGACAWEFQGSHSWGPVLLSSPWAEQLDPGVQHPGCNESGLRLLGKIKRNIDTYQWPVLRTHSLSLTAFAKILMIRCRGLVGSVYQGSCNGP